MMKSRRKKLVVLTILDIVIVLAAEYWVLWLVFYFGQSIDGGIYISGKYNIFERNYLVPAQIFGITIAVTAATVIFYHRLRKKELIGKRYIILAFFNIIPLLLLSVAQIESMVYYWELIY